MVELDLDILTATPRTIMLFGKERIFKEIPMQESFKVDHLTESMREIEMNGKKDTPEYHEKLKTVLTTLIEPITDEEISQLSKRQYTAIMNELDYQDSLDQGIVKNRDDYNELKDKAIETRKKILLESQTTQEEDVESFPE